MHGGAPGSGAPPGNKNALKHGQYTRKALAQLKMLQMS
jgi:glucans biosynthesis protein